MKNIDFTESDQNAALVASADVAYDASFWGLVQKELDRIQGHVKIKPRKGAEQRTQSEHYGR